jgi:S-formylglutathione hydrolase FrmB
MAFAHLHFRSDVLGKQVGAYAVIPDVPGPWATFYLLHGLSDDYTIWHRRTRIEAYAEGLPLLIVMPDGYRGFYTNANNGPRYADYMALDVVNFIDRAFPTKASRDGRAIGGLSMGGYGALRLGLGYPDRFCSVNSHTGAVMHGSRTEPGSPRPNMGHDEWGLIFGDHPAGTDHDILTLAQRAKKARLLPTIRVDCGTEDFLLDSNRRLHAEFEKLKIPHQYEEFPGDHNWDYWDLHVRSALAFHAKNLKLRKA